MFNLFKSLEQIVQDEIQETNRLLNDIINHARKSSKNFTLSDLITYKNRFIKLNNSRYYMQSLIQGNLTRDAHCMSHIIQAMIKVMETTNENNLSTVQREIIGDYKNFYDKYLNDDTSYQVINDFTDNKINKNEETYKKVKIGNQIWMAENLAINSFRNGDPIIGPKTKSEWIEAGEKGQSVYSSLENETRNDSKYGKLYNWYAVNDKRGLAPKGWHIPSTHEFEILLSYIQNDGNKLKKIGCGKGDGCGTNETGFSLSLAGGRMNEGTYLQTDFYTCLWTSSERNQNYAYGLVLVDTIKLIYLTYGDKACGGSIRCIKD